MASKIRIFRSTGATAPSSLEYGELAVTVEDATPGTSANKAGRLFVGNSSGNPVELGGEYTYKLMDHVHGQLINSSVAIVDAQGQIDGWNVLGISTAQRTDFVDTVTGNLSVTGIATFGQDLNLNGNVTIGDAHTDIITINGRTGFSTDVTINENLLVSGIATVSGNTTILGNLDVDGQAIFDDITVSAASTFAGAITAQSAVVFESTIDVDGQAIFDDITVSAASTFAGSVDLNGGANVSGGAGLVVSANGINVSGASTFVDNVLFNNRIDVDGGADFDDIVVGTAATFSGPADFNNTVTIADYTMPASDGAANQVLTTNGSGTLSFEEISSTLVISAGYASTDPIDLRTETLTIASTLNETRTTLSDNTITVGLATDIVVGGGMTITNNLLVLGDLTVEGTETIINVERLDVQDKTIGVASTSTASNATANGGGFFVHAGSDGDKTIFWNLTQGGFEVNQDWLPESDGSFDLGNASREWQNLFVDGLAELDDVNVSAAATINTLNVTGTGTIATADINGGNIDGTTIGAASSAVGTFTTLNGGTIVTGGRLDAVDVSLTNLIVSGITTTSGLLDVNAGTNVSGGAGLVVSADGLNVTGISTFNDAVNFSGTIDVDGQAIFDDVTVSAAATITTVDINGGNIDGTVIGAASSTSATFTTVNYTSLTGGAIVATGSRIDAGDVTFENLIVTGVSTVATLFLSAGTNTNGVAYFDSSGQVTSTATPSAGIQTSNFILTTNASGVPSWTDTIDGGQF